MRRCVTVCRRCEGAGACIEAANLDAISDGFDAILLDAFGVLNIGDTAIPGVAARIAGLRARGCRVTVLTNAASYPLDALVAKYARLGFDFGPDEVVSSRVALVGALDGAAGAHWGLMLPRAAGTADLRGLSFDYLEDAPAIYRDAEAFMLLGSAEWTEARQQSAVGRAGAASAASLGRQSRHRRTARSRLLDRAWPFRAPPCRPYRRCTALLRQTLQQHLRSRLRAAGRHRPLAHPDGRRQPAHRRAGRARGGHRRRR